MSVVYFITLPFLGRKILTFYMNDVLLFKCPVPGPKGYLTTCFKSYFCCNVEAISVSKEDICYFSVMSLWLLAFWFKGPWWNVSVDEKFYMHTVHALQDLCLKYRFYKLWLSCWPFGAFLLRPCVFTVMFRIPSCNHTLHSSRCGLGKGSKTQHGGEATSLMFEFALT